MPDPIDDLTTVEEMPVAPDQCSPGDKQRLRIHVPNVSTTLSMGAQAPADAQRDLDGGEPNYNGFGVHTLGHIFMDAAKNKDESTATFQAKGYVNIQSQDSHLWMGAKQSSVLHGAEHVIVNGGNGLFMGTGIMFDPPKNQENDGSEPKVPDWLSGIAPAATQTANFWGLVDMYAGVLELAVTAVQGSLDVYHETGWGKLRAALWTFFQMTIGELGAGVGDIAKQGTLFPSKTDGSTIIHSRGGMVLGAEQSLGLFSTVGTTVGSATFAGVTAPWASMLGLDSFEIQALARSGSVAARTELDLVGGKSVNVASRSGTASLIGATVNIGNAEGGGPQKPTTDISITSKERTVVGSLGAMEVGGETASFWGKTSLEISAPKLTIGGTGETNITGKEIGIIGNEGVSIGVGKTAIQIDGKSVSLGYFSDKAETSIGDLESALKAAQDDLADMERRAPRQSGGAIRWSGDKVDGVDVPTFGQKKKEKFAALVKEVGKLTKKIHGLKQEKNFIMVGKNGIEITHEGMKFKLDSGKVKSGSLVWQK